MSFFNDMKDKWNTEVKDEHERNRIIKEEKYIKAYNKKKDIVTNDSYSRNNMQEHPEEYLYKPGHKDSVGTAKSTALINLLCTADLDEVIEKCAPEFTKALYLIRNTVIQNQVALRKQKEMEENRYNALQQGIEVLIQQNKDLLEEIKRLKKS